MVVELKEFFFKTLYCWAAAFGINISSFHVFLSVFTYQKKKKVFFICFLFLVRCISYLGCTFALFKKIAITYKKI